MRENSIIIQINQVLRLIWSEYYHRPSNTTLLETLTRAMGDTLY